MELVKIEELLRKYENAETSLQEEAALKTYFSSDVVAPHLHEYKALFNYFEKSGNETYTKAIPLKRDRPNVWWLSIAASILVVFSVYFITDSGELSAQEQREAELAFQETQKAFQLISQNLNKGESVAFAGLSEFEKAQNKVFKVNK